MPLNAKKIFLLTYLHRRRCRKFGFQYYKTSSYKLNFFETLTGLKFVLTTDLNVGDISSELREIYSQVHIRSQCAPFPH
eukprot:m.152626 g.152626  ORF g.152626 m.152626 type:complete len:79 (-) comp10166_c0_seq4:365-601(-)